MMRLQRAAGRRRRGHVSGGATTTPWPTPRAATAARPGAPLRLPLSPRRDPGPCEPSLRANASARSASLRLVHGLAHANHAPPGEKKAEFGAASSLARLARDAERGPAPSHPRGLRTDAPAGLRAALEPDRARTCRPALPGAGFAACPPSATEARRERVAGLVEINTHVDPIDWHGGRSLRDAGSIVATLAQAVTAAHRAKGGSSGSRSDF